MPQSDLTFAISQVFWLFITWLSVFLFIKIYAWPRINKRQEERKKETEKWIDQTATRQAEIDDWNNTYERTLSNAKREERENMQTKLGTVEKDLEKKRIEFLDNVRDQPVETEAFDHSDIKQSLKKWDEACWNKLPFSSH